MSRNLYTEDKEQMENDVEMHKKRVWSIIKITFVAFAALLFIFFVSLVISLIVGDNNADVAPPEFTGPPNNVVIGYVGENPVYKKWVTVVDNVDENVSVKVNNNSVDINKEGEYPVYYMATDEAGNVAKYQLTYIVKSKDYSREQLMTLIAEEASEFGITKGMTKTQQVRNIYSYVQSKIKWEDGESGIGESNIPDIDRNNWENDWIEEAVRTLDTRVGDCYSYYSLSKAFFEYFGINNEGIKRSEKSKMEGTHFWHVVEVEEGWYYYDGTRLAGEFGDGTGDRNACLITQAKLDSYLTSDGDDDFYAMDRKISKVSKRELAN